MKDNFKIIWRFGKRGSACGRFETLLSLYADGMASAKEAGRVEAHIESCESCRALLAAARATSVTLAEKPAPEFPAGLSERLRRAIAEERLLAAPRTLPAARRRVLFPRLALAGALASVLLVAAVFISTHQRASTVPVAIAPKAPARVALAPTAPPNAVPAARKPHSLARPEAVASAIAAHSIPHRETAGAFAGRTQGLRRPETPLERTASALAPSERAIARPHFAAKHDMPLHPVVVASAPRPASSSGRAFPAPHALAPNRASSGEIAALPAQPILPSPHSAPPATVNSVASGEQSVRIAQLPAGDQAQPAAATTGRIRLASRLKLVDNIGQVSHVAINEEPRTDYSGSLAIVGSSIH